MHNVPLKSGVILIEKAGKDFLLVLIRLYYEVS
jgi:hypothetical protein